MPKFLLINQTQPSEVKEIDLTPEKMLNCECLLGRDPRCCLVLNNALVSSQHGKIVSKEGQYYFQDLGSRNGSRINNEVVKPNQSYLLKPRDTIQIGSYTLLVQSLGESIDIVATVDLCPEPSDYMPLATIDPSEVHRWTKGDLTVRCLRVVEETPDVKTFVFVASPPQLFTYQPGQFVTLDLEIEGKRVMRSYSISSTPSRPHTLEITVKRVPSPSDAPDAPPGLVSNWLHDRITVGSEVKLAGPMGKFTCFANPSQKLLFISAGSGITPMMSMSRWLCDTASDVDMVFVHSARSPRDLIFRQELEWMAAQHPNFKLAVTTTRWTPGQAWLGYTGRLNDAMLQAIAPDYTERTVYVCGPNPFMEGVKAMLESMDFPMQNYYAESFGGPKKSPKPKATASNQVAPSFGIGAEIAQLQPLTPATETNLNGNSSTSSSVALLPPKPETTSETAVVFEQSGKTVAWNGEDSILELAEQEGIAIGSGCRMGACGACAAKLLSGEVTYTSEPSALSDDDRSNRTILTCIAHPKGQAIVEA